MNTAQRPKNTTTNTVKKPKALSITKKTSPSIMNTTTNMPPITTMKKSKTTNTSGFR